MNARADFRFFDRLRVRWVEVDMQHIVFNGHYLMYFDTAVAGYWRALAMPYHESMAALAGDLYARKATVEYEASARFDDRIDVGVRVGRIGTSSMLLHCAVFRGEQRLVQGELVYVFADPATMSSRPIPEGLRAILRDYEAGQPMLELRSGDWRTLGADARRIRRAVFFDEQKIPAPLDEDGADAEARHIVAYNRLGAAVATGRVLAGEGGRATLARLAVHPALRGSGFGRQVLHALLAEAMQMGAQRVDLQAQVSALGLYVAAGFAPQGSPFEVAGVTHQAMSRALSGAEVVPAIVI